MKANIFFTFTVLTLVLCAYRPASAYTNPPIPNSSGVTTETCDVRSNQDAGEKTLRHRIELFNTQEQCIFGIYFLDPYIITLEKPLEIKAITHLLNDGNTMAGTYISGAKANGNALPVIIDAQAITAQDGQCAFMIEGGFNSFQQIHDLSILTTKTSQAICDKNGNDLYNVVSPNCDGDKLGRDCDFKDVEISFSQGEDVVVGGCDDADSDGVCDDDEILDCINKPGTLALEGCPASDYCRDQVTSEVTEKSGDDVDNDKVDDACDSLIDSDKDGIGDDDDLCDATGGSKATFGLNTDIIGQLSKIGFKFQKLSSEKKFQMIKVDNIAYKVAIPLYNIAPVYQVMSSKFNPQDSIVKVPEIDIGFPGDKPKPNPQPQPDVDPGICGIALTQTGDIDGDKKGDACDDDIDGDGLLNDDDPYPCDEDGDGDGVKDPDDECPFDESATIKPCVKETQPIDIDTDGDGFTDKVEDQIGTKADNPDSDGDGICDGPLAIQDVCLAGPDCEPLNELKGPGDTCFNTVDEGNIDSDGDGLSDDKEAEIGTDPELADTDGDGTDDDEDCAPLDADILAIFFELLLSCQR